MQPSIAAMYPENSDIFFVLRQGKILSIFTLRPLPQQ